MRKYVFHLYNYIFHVCAGRPGGYPEAFLNKIKKIKKKNLPNIDECICVSLQNVGRCH